MVIYGGWLLRLFAVGAAWMLDGVFIGAARGRDMRNMMSISFCILLDCSARSNAKYGQCWALGGVIDFVCCARRDFRDTLSCVGAQC